MDEGLPEGIFGLLALGVIAYLIAQDANKKGKSGLMWGLLCFFTCLVAVPLYFLFTSTEGEKK